MIVSNLCKDIVAIIVLYSAHTYGNIKTCDKCRLNNNKSQEYEEEYVTNTFCLGCGKELNSVEKRGKYDFVMYYNTSWWHINCLVSNCSVKKQLFAKIS